MKNVKILITFIMTFLINLNVFAVDMTRYKIQEPKGSSMELVAFTPTLINFPFEIKYPKKWYVREDATAFPSLFLTQEPIRNDGDRYKVGVALLYNIGYFMIKEPTDSTLGKTAESVFKMRDWGLSKKQFVADINAGGNSVISHSDITISGQAALRVDYESSRTRATAIYVKVDTHLLAIIFETPPQEYAQYETIFDNILNSFSFTR